MTEAVHHEWMVLRLAIGSSLAITCAVVLVWLPVKSAHARPGRIQLKLAPGALKVSAPAVNAVTGRAVKVVVTVTDGRGTGSGWSLKTSSPRPVSITRITATCAPGSTCTLPRAGSLGLRSLVLRARPASGMGVLRLAVMLAPLRSGRPVPVKFVLAP